MQGSLAYTALYHDAPTVARELCAEALELSVARDDPYLFALTAGNTGLAALFDGDCDAAFRAVLYEQLLDAVALHRVANRPDRFEPRYRKRRSKR